MAERCPIVGAGARVCLALLVGAVTSCGNGSTAGAPKNGSTDLDGAPGDATTATLSGDSDTSPDVGENQSSVQSAEASAGGSADAGTGQDAIGNASDSGLLMDGGVAQTDGGIQGGSDARDIGSCCATQNTPGCDNASLEVCACEKDPTCCTTAWGPPCVLIVQQKYCQPGVRDCVCGTDAGQWGQTDCCNTDWTSTCDSVATLKCNAVQGCF